MQSSGAGARAFQNARLQKKLKKQADAIISTANAAYGQGRYAETEALCRQILNELPEHFGALHLLGLGAFASRQFEAAKQGTEICRDARPTLRTGFFRFGSHAFRTWGI